MNPQFPVYIISKGRWEFGRRLTSRHLDEIGVPYRIVVEEQERDLYAEVVDPAKILVLDPAYKDVYDTCDDLGDSRTKGSGPARGNTDELYAGGTRAKSEMIVRLHPDVSKLVWRYNRWHHHTDYGVFDHPLVRRTDLPSGVDNYGMRLRDLP